MPCNYNHRRLASAVKEGIRAAGGTPMEFNTISVSDGVSMGTEGMKASLVSREVVADSLSSSAAPSLRWARLHLRLRQDGTGLGDGPRPARHPGARPLSGTIHPGIRSAAMGGNGSRDATVVTIYEAIGAYRAGKISLDDLYEVENASCPGPGACGASSPPTR